MSQYTHTHNTAGAERCERALNSMGYSSLGALHNELPLPRREQLNAQADIAFAVNATHPGKCACNWSTLVKI
jgi:hypothetical protein